jgi:hypothetical protein
MLSESGLERLNRWFIRSSKPCFWVVVVVRFYSSCWHIISYALSSLMATYKTTSTQRTHIIQVYLIDIYCASGCIVQGRVRDYTLLTIMRLKVLAWLTILCSILRKRLMFIPFQNVIYWSWIVGLVFSFNRLSRLDRSIVLNHG